MGRPERISQSCYVHLLRPCTRPAPGSGPDVGCAVRLSLALLCVLCQFPPSLPTSDPVTVESHQAYGCLEAEEAENYLRICKTKFLPPWLPPAVR